MSKKHSRVRNVSTSTRACIIDLLCLCDEGAFANDIVPARLSRSSFSDSDRALITKVVYSTLRAQVRIDFALSKVSNRPLNKLDPIALAALRSIVAQLIDGFDMYAVVDETIKVVPFSLKGFINALARKVIALHEKGDLFVGESAETASALPSWIFEEVHKVFGERADAAIDALNGSASVTLAPMHDGAINVEGARVGEIIPESRLVKSSGAISQLDAVSSGSAIVVDQGSQLVVQCVDEKDQLVLDVCCAPGGKSFLLSRGAKAVISCDVSANRMQKLLDTQSRLHRSNVEILACDARALPFTVESFDRVLVDAPCSGLGVLRRRPDARHRIALDDVAELVRLQREIVLSASQMVKAGGKLVYSVCTFTVAETIEMDEWMKNELPDFKADEMEFTTPLVQPLGRGYILTPTADNDAMYVLRLTKS